MDITVNNERVIRAVVRQAVQSFAHGFAARHILEADAPNGTINLNMHNVFLAPLGFEIQYYSALVRSLDSSLENMLEKLAINLASLHYEVSQHVEGEVYRSQTDFIAELLERYTANHKKPQTSDYKGITQMTESASHSKRHESDYYLKDPNTGMHYLIELKIGGDLDNKKARSEKEALLEQYCILANGLGSEENIRLFFATAYNRYGEGKPWKQGRVCQFFAEDELLISSKFWNFVCKSDKGYDIIIDEYKRNVHYLVETLGRIKDVYLR